MEQIQEIYTDGSQKNNGKEGNGSIGIFFGDNDKRNLSEIVKNSTNNICELTAIKRALEIYQKNCIIYTDSKYCIKCLTEWYISWLKNPKKMKDKKNIPLIKSIYDLIEKRKKEGISIELRYIKGHKGNYGNEQADKLATFYYKNN